MADYVSQYLGEEIDQYLGEGHAAYNQLGGKASAEELAAETAARIQAVTLEKEAREAADKALAADAHKTYPTRIEKLADFAYSAHYDTVNYEEAKKYFASNYEATVGACSAFWKDGVLYRNYDWYYSNNAGFLVHTPAANDRHAVNGFAGYLKGLTMAVVDSGEWHDKYRILPYLMTDGVNDAGLSAAVLVCENKDVTPTAQNTGKKKMNGLFVVRYVLDNHTDALEAAQDIANNYDVYMPHTDSVDEELHFIIGDKEKCVILEFVDNETKIITDRNFVTNFKLYNTLSNADGTIKYNTVHPYGQGVERYNLIAKSYETSPSAELLLSLKYTNAYQGDIEGAWRTEFTGINDNLTVLAAFVEPERYSQILAAARTAFLARTRSEEKTWQTCHSVIFDSNTKKITFFVQEDHHRVWTYDTTSPIDELGKKIGNLGNLTTPKKSDLVSAINEVYETVVITANLTWPLGDGGLPAAKTFPVRQIYEVASADGNRGKMIKVVANDDTGRFCNCMVSFSGKLSDYNIFAFIPYGDNLALYKMHYAPNMPQKTPEILYLANSVNKVNLSDSTSTDRWPNMTVAEFDEVIEKSGINYDTMYPVVVTWKSQNKVYLVQSILTANTSVVRLLDINIMEMYDYALDSKTQTVAKTYVNRLTNLSDVSSYFQKMAGAIIGDVSTLNTTEKLVVPAINEVYGHIQEQLLFKLNYDEEAYPLLQPTAYDADTGYFTCESMPAWATDGVKANIYIKNILNWTKIPYVYSTSANNMGEATIHIVDETHFYVEWLDSSSSIPANVDCSCFAFCYFSYDFKSVICPLDGRTAGSDYIRIEWDNLNSFPSYYTGAIGFISSLNPSNYHAYIKSVYCLALLYQRRHVIASRGSMIIRVDKTTNDVSVNLISGSQESMYRDSKTSTSISTMVTVLDKNKLNIWGGGSSDIVLTSLPLTPASEVRVYKLNNKLF